MGFLLLPKTAERSRILGTEWLGYANCVSVFAPNGREVFRWDSARKCAVCGKWFLTTDARHTKYCSGYAPNDKRGRTCRQVGNLRGREQRELAADHPIKKIYTKRFNTITQYLGRGTLDEQTAAAMKKLAKRKMERAIREPSYAQGSYAAEMEQAALLAEAKETMKR